MSLLTNFIVLSKFTDSNFWKILLAVLFVIIAFFAIFGLVGRLVEKIIDFQSRKIDRLMAPLILSGLIDDEQKFYTVANTKNKKYFFKTSLIPVIFIIFALLLWITYHSFVGNWDESFLNDTTGIGTLFFTWDFSNAYYVFPFGIGGVELKNTPHFLLNVQMINYFIALFFAVGIIWYLINVQGYVARMFRIKKLRETMFSQNLDNVDLATIFNNSTNINSNNNNSSNLNQ